MKRHIIDASKMGFFVAYEAINSVFTLFIVDLYQAIGKQYGRLDKIRALMKKLHNEKSMIKRTVIVSWHCVLIVRKALYAAYRGVLDYFENFFTNLRGNSELLTKRIRFRHWKVYVSEATARRIINGEFSKDSKLTTQSVSTAQPAVNLTTSAVNEIDADAINASTSVSRTHPPVPPNMTDSTHQIGTGQRHSSKVSENQGQATHNHSAL